jgi:peptide-methionine (S)-S-oxide reductase
VCTGLTGHAETVRVVFEPAILSYAELLALFWENHDPTQGMRQGGDVGTTYRSAIHTLTADQQAAALASRDVYQAALEASGFSAAITTEIAGNDAFYFAEAEHQQYPARNPGSHFELKGTGVRFPAPPVGA